MERQLERCCGLDVHKETIAACVRIGGQSGRAAQYVQTFRTTAAELLVLRDWLAAHGVTHVAMESTGVYWKPVFYALESEFTCLLVNAAHIKQVPGRKTDVHDCVWIAQLLEHGLLRGSFVPPVPIRELRDLTRYRKALIHDRTRVANRLHKALEDAGVKLASAGPRALQWEAATRDRVTRILKNPAYAGAVVNGRRGRVKDENTGRQRWETRRSYDRCLVMRDTHEGYITWEEHLRLLAVIARNTVSKGYSTGAALLSGLGLVAVRCVRRAGGGPVQRPHAPPARQGDAHDAVLLHLHPTGCPSARKELPGPCRPVHRPCRCRLDPP
jgi:hypothetical protein